MEQIRLRPGMTVGQLVEEMDRCGVLGAGRVARAVNVMVEMFSDPGYTVFLGLAGPMVAGGLRRIVGDLIDHGYIDAVVTSGANVVHDVIEALGYGHLKGSFMADDAGLRGEGLGRVGDVYIEQKAFEAFERRMHETLDGLPEDKRGRMPFYQLLDELGKRLEDAESILARASKRGVPVFSPGLLDSMVGLHVWTYTQLKRLGLDPVGDLKRLSDVVFASERVGAIMLGGGIPKHHILAANILRDGIDAAVQITLDRPEGGSLSGAPLEEAVSWRKARVGARLVTVVGDATAVFPIMVAAVLERMEKDPS
ncbi:MAG: deoxyhypusine synthase [Candidatus Bathyarchaeia archaeon]